MEFKTLPYCTVCYIKSCFCFVYSWKKCKVLASSWGYAPFGDSARLFLSAEAHREQRLFVSAADQWTVFRVNLLVSEGWPIPGWGYCYILPFIIKKVCQVISSHSHRHHHTVGLLQQPYQHCYIGKITVTVLFCYQRYYRFMTTELHSMIP